jgi:hypothetical protein
MKNHTCLSISSQSLATMIRLNLWAILCFACPCAISGQDPKTTFFETKIRPILVQSCYECHSSSSKAIKGGLKLDSKSSTLKGGDGGAVIVPGKPEESPLFLAIKYQGDAENMPPNGKLADTVIADFKTWITDGAHDPRPESEGVSENPANPDKSWQETFRKRLNWWSFQPLAKAQPPSMDEFRYQNPVDRFLAQKMAQKHLKMSPKADRETLLRRLYFDLIGLPPTEPEIDSFLNDQSPDAYEKLVDKLLNSPHYGERTARRWMDLTHYSETVGSEQDALIPYSWAYRDYLIKAFNLDLPYDQLLKEHLAGDLIQPTRRDNVTGLAESPVGTSWMRFVEYYHSPVDVKNEEITVIDNQVDTFGKTFLGLTIACARCHDHKFDPIGTDDFYKLYGIFRTARASVHTLADPNRIKPQVTEIIAQQKILRDEIGKIWNSDLVKLAPLILSSVQAGKPVDPNLANFLKTALASPMKVANTFAVTQKAIVDKADFKAAWLNARKTIQDQGIASWKKAGSKQLLMADFTNPKAFPSGWTVQSHFTPTHSSAGTIRLGPKPEQVVDFIRPSGFYSDSISEKFGISLRSPEFTLTGGTYSVLVSGTSNARLRLVVDNFQGVDILFGGVTPVLNNPRLSWVKLPVRDIWKGQQAYLELVTRDEMPSTTVIRDLNQLPRDGRSSAGIRYVVHHENAENVHEDSQALAELKTTKAFDINTIQAEQIAADLNQKIRNAVIAFSENRLSDDQSSLIQDLLDSKLLTNSTTAGSELSQAIRSFRALEDKIDLSAKSVGAAESAPSNLNQQVFIRGDHKRLGAVTKPANLQSLNPSHQSFTNSKPARLELAESLVKSENPVVSRVMANRIWYWYFGQGLFSTIDNVGHLGEPPTHPELLDWLAAQLMTEGWSIKKLTRHIVTSDAYRQSSFGTNQAHEVDPTNRLISHAPVKRLDAESLRDAVITASGRLDRTLYGLPLPTPQPPGLTDDKKPISGPIDGAGRRSLYLNVRKNFPVEFMEIFDRPRPTLTVGKRNVSNQPAQALAMMNDPFIKGESERLGQSLSANSKIDDPAKLKSLYLRVLGRSPDAKEMSRAQAYLKAGNSWPDLVQAMFETKEFLYLD